MRGREESVMTSLLQSKDHHHSYNEADLKTLQKFKEYAPKIELTKIVKTRKLLLEGAAKGTRTRQQIHQAYSSKKSEPPAARKTVTSKLASMRTLREGIRLPMLDCDALERAAKKRTGSRADSGATS